MLKLFSTGFWNALARLILRRSFLTRKKRGSFDKNIQPPIRTNALLKKAGIDFHSLNEYLPSELGEILGVECIIMGTFETSKPMSHLNVSGTSSTARDQKLV